jgi:AcrR family transcriptional regulator
MVVPKSCETLDPRVRRTRQLLQQALQKMLEQKEFEDISVQDITEAATVNRATFYDHFTDKFALLEYMVAGDFHALLAEREIQFDGSCASGLRPIVMAVCDYLARMHGPECRRQSHSHMEAAIIAVVRRIVVEGLKLHAPKSTVSAEMMAAAASWAIYGAAREWVQTPDRCSSEEIAETVATLVSPILQQPPAAGNN